MSEDEMNIDEGLWERSGAVVTIIRRQLGRCPTQRSGVSELWYVLAYGVLLFQFFFTPTP